ncbi:cupredoxin domain-containing protein [Mycobacterium sp. NPDC003449]
MRRFAAICAAVCLLAALTAACGQSDGNSAQDSGTRTATATATASPTAEPAPGGPSITIRGMGFSGPLTVAPGATITIVNDDEVEHSVTSRTKDLFDVHVDGKQRATLTAPTEPGDYAFYCIYHPAMKGTLTVK